VALDPYTRRSWRGVTANLRTIEMLEITELRALRSLTPLSIPQGSYNAGGVSASGGTHDGGGALDVSVRGMTWTQKSQTVVRALRETGFAAWYRAYLPGVWSEHIHCIAIGDKQLSPAARDQVVDYYAGRNGLANNGPDNGPRISPIPVYRQDIDMSYYGPEKWDAVDFTRLFTKLLDWPIGALNRPDTGEVASVDVGAALRAARWCFYRLSNAGLDGVAKELFTADGIIPNVGVTSPSGAFMTLATAISNMENTQDTDTKVLSSVKADTAAILGKLPPPA
jgi:hypothetical protein